MLRYLTLVRCVTYMDQDGDLMIKLNSFIFSKGGGGGGKSTQTNYLCSGVIELQFNTIINYLTHSCEAADVSNGSEMPLLCCHNPAVKTCTHSPGSGLAKCISSFLSWFTQTTGGFHASGTTKIQI